MCGCSWVKNLPSTRRLSQKQKRCGILSSKLSCSSTIGLGRVRRLSQVVGWIWQSVALVARRVTVLMVWRLVTQQQNPIVPLHQPCRDLSQARDRQMESRRKEAVVEHVRWHFLPTLVKCSVCGAAQFLYTADVFYIQTATLTGIFCWIHVLLWSSSETQLFYHLFMTLLVQHLLLTSRYCHGQM